MDFECNCGRNFKTQRSINSHARFCSDYTGKRKSEYLTEGNKYLCECGRIFEKSQSLNAHFSHCIIHRKDKPAIDRFLNSRGWSKGKTKESDNRILEIGRKLSHNIKDGLTIAPFKNKRHTKDTKKRMSITRSNMYIDNSMHCKFYEISNGDKIFKVQGTYERDFGLFLNDKSIKWDRIRILYDETHHYTPDFYISDLGIYIEIKGWLMKRDIDKYRKFFNEHDTEIYCCTKKNLHRVISGEIKFKDLPLLRSLI